MYRYEIINGKDAMIYLDDELVAFAKHWDTPEGAENWAQIMVAKLDNELGITQTEASTEQDKEAARQALLDKLGITEEEAKLLLS